ncbi:hypothetical protein PGT21_027683 [Puccinia graminis f. sp. tritici]|uniref:Uncharacterized protein n=1 Tax=Puccinia graminis f. sp. tritici TaxID=56615 RepID=A0A5B0NFH3_PUCGR|nr:hypothetical protein PGT21_027683 [Puccinia graminis f. sp. tritici]
MAPSRNLKGEPTDDLELNGRKVVWKPVLSTPFIIQWPEISDQVGNQFLEELVKFLDGRDDSDNLGCTQSHNPSVAPCINQSKNPNGKTEEQCFLKASRRTPRLAHVVQLRSGKKVEIPDYVPPKRSKFHDLGGDSPDTASLINKPLGRVVSGINSTTKELEKEIQQKREAIPHTYFENSSIMEQHPSSISTSRLLENSSCPQLSHVFVCRKDINPVSLVDHLLPTVANLNQSRLQSESSSAEDFVPPPLVFLISLPKGAEKVIAGALGLKRAAVVALKGEDARMCALSQLARQHVKPVLPPSHTRSPIGSDATPYNMIPNESVVLFPTHIKHYKTTIPTDLRKHHLERSQSKKQRKYAKKEKNDQDVASLMKT